MGRRPVDWKYINLTKFLINKTKYSKAPLSISQLARECMEKRWCSQDFKSLYSRIYKFRSGVHRWGSIDTATKVRVLFGLSAPTDEDFLKELRMDAHVEVDENNRITKYKAKDGSLELEGEHSHSAKVKEAVKQKKRGKPEDSGDEHQVSTHKTTGSMKKAAPEVPNSSKMTKDSPPDDSSRVPESRARELVRRFSPNSPNSNVQQLLQPKKQSEMRNEKSQKDSDDGSQESVPKTPGSVKSVATEVPNPSRRAKDSSSTRSRRIEGHAPNDSTGIPESGAKERSSPKTPNPGIRSPQQPKVEEVPETPSSKKSGAPRTPKGDIPQEKPIKTEPEADDGYTSRIKFLEAIHSLVLSLDIRILSTLLTRIEKKLRELSSNERIPNDEMAAALELFVVKITNTSVSNLSENVESVSLTHFLCYLKSLILNSKLEGLEKLLEKIRGRIEEPALKDKIIPVKKVATALHSVLRATGF